MIEIASAKIRRGESVPFGQLELCATTVKWKEQAPVPLVELDSVQINGATLRIKRVGRWLGVVRVRSDKIPDVLVFLELVESLAPQLKSTAMDPVARIRL